MKYDPEIHNRRSIRLPGYDYSGPGAYFVTLCAFDKQCQFGQIADGQMELNKYGQAVEEEWFRSAGIRQEIELDMFVVMPNHVHGIVRIAGALLAHEPQGGGRRPRPQQGGRRPPLQMRARSVSSFMAGFKSATTHRIRTMCGKLDAAVWQRGYYEHIIRNEDEFAKIREYIATNSLRWATDRENPHAIRGDNDDAPWDL